MKRKKTCRPDEHPHGSKALDQPFSGSSSLRLREIATRHDFSVGASDLIYLNNGLVRHPHGSSSAGASQEMPRHPCRSRRFAV